MSVKLTEQQRLAVQCRDSSLTVSAAAGAGKTAVLVQRVIGLLTEKENPCGIEELLVVTFTNAAAGEMRERVGKALNDRLAEEPGNAMLRRQLALLGSSHIQTVHAFCQQLVREHFSLLGVEPDFRLADETQSKLLQQKALEETLEQAYAAPTPGFSALFSNLTDGRTDRALENAVMDIYRKLCSHPAPDAMLAALPGISAALPEDSAWGKWMLEYAGRQVSFACTALRRLRLETEGEPEIEEKVGPLLDGYLEFGDTLLQSLQNGWDAACRAVAEFDKKRMPVCRKADKAVLDRIKAGRDLFVSRIQNLQKECFSQDVSRAAQEGETVRPMTEALCGLVKDFTERYRQYKRQKGLLDFNDLEHLTLRLLQEEDGQPSGVALELQNRFREILVDEYQDTNETQERIFRLLRRKGDSAFFVGDVKQSIYGFRLADPAIFSDRYLASEPYTGEKGGARRLSLNRNFRSRPEVLSLCNYIFSRTMTADFGDVDYDEDQRLYAGRQVSGTVPSEVLLLDCTHREDVEEEEARTVLEARLVARRIRRLLTEETVPEENGSRPARPEDVAILLSSFTNKSPVFQRELMKAGIHCAAGGGAFFGTVEISVMLSLLRLICNQRQDIPLVSVLRSPFYFFSPQKLAEIRLQSGDGELLDGLYKLSETDPACRKVLRDLAHYREEALELPPSRLLRLIYDETGAEGVFSALDNGAGRTANLRRLENLLRGFDSAGTGGLSAFLRWVDEKLAEGEEPDMPEGESQGVRLMSIHHSKGLEYPFVIVPDLSKQFNSDDLRKPVLFHVDMGLGLRLRDQVTHSDSKTLLQQAIVLRQRSTLRGEELRKLYVAMTRAREKLILVMSQSKLGELVNKVHQETAGQPDPVWLAQQNNAMAWILAALLSHPGAEPLRALCAERPAVDLDAEKEALLCEVLSSAALEEPDTVMLRPLEDETDALRERLTEEQRARFAPLLAMAEREYGHLDASRLPSKLTPTGLKKLIPETGEVYGEPAAAAARDHHALSLQKPDRNAALRGTAMHKLLRWADLSQCGSDEAVMEQAALLHRQGKLSTEELALVWPQPIIAFAASDLAVRTRSAQRVLREYQFSVLVDASELLQDGPKGEEILLNGAIDLLLFEKDSLTVVDFKTDRAQPGTETEKAKEHQLQLELYARAAEKVFGLPVKERWVWFLRNGISVQI